MTLHRRLRLRHLETLVEIAGRQSVTRAAEALGITQPAASRTLSELEEICGAALVRRSGRGIQLTTAGEIMLRYAGASVASAEAGVAALASLHDAAAQAIRIGALPTVSAGLVPQAVVACREAGFKNRLLVSTGEQSFLLDRLRADDLDLVLGRMPDPEAMTGLTFEPLYREPIVFLVSRDHPLSGLTSMRLDAILDHPVVMPQPGSIIRSLVDRVFVEHGIAAPAHAVESVSDSLGRAMVARHGAVWVISQGVARHEVERGIFRALPIDTSSTFGPIGLSRRQAAPPTAGVDAFVGIVRELGVAMNTHSV